MTYLSLIADKLDLEYQTILRGEISWLKLNFYLLGDSISMAEQSSAGLLFQQTGSQPEEITWDGVQCITTGFGVDTSIAPPDLHVPLISQFTYKQPVFENDT